eukprot:CAMPEP_0177231776 /NCGR_PEP_ID=MMETSP0367-20130122/42948_1 /TAXON_ID=447022 ORGANISM="Scrippsiella hangoei-like, Strain SHHI-4" /NCGR_SAMPLE_ID=MMETSP0367 /ASSEMBLY_ACC=CAM_ASM_000362 /LENGTH=224 /DNA_ID=CAMNT_0018682335 /DNA_START=14 /DNA_END=688 /DNA_ORIENTATION=-
MPIGEPNLNALSCFKNARRIKFESKVPIKEYLGQGPGPIYAVVDIEKTRFKRTPAITMASSTRPSDKFNKAPGPGQYGVVGPSCIELGRGFTWGSTSRLPKPKEMKAPGPGSYTSTTTLGGVSVAMTGATKSNYRPQAPGPGQYTPSHTQLEKEYPSISFTESGFGKDKPKNIPGPGQYELPSTLGGNTTLRRVPSYSMTAATTKVMTSETPAFCGQPTTFKTP